MSDSVTMWMDCSIPGFPVFHYLLEFPQTHVYWSSDAIKPSYPLSPLCLLPSIFPSIFCSELILHIRWPAFWNFSIRPSNGYSMLISFKIDWFDFLAVRGTFKHLLQFHCLKASIIQHSAFFMVQFSQWYTTTGKTIVLTIPTFVSLISCFFSYHYYSVYKTPTIHRKSSCMF